MEYQLECAHQYSNTGTNAHTFKKRKKKEKTKIEDEKMIEFHVRDTMNRMIKSIEESCGSTSNVRTKSSWEMAKDWIASQSPFSPGSSKKTRKTRKKKKKSKWKFVRKLFGLKKSKKKKKSPRKRSNSNDVSVAKQKREEKEEDDEDSREMNVLNDETENEEKEKLLEEEYEPALHRVSNDNTIRCKFVEIFLLF